MKLPAPLKAFAGLAAAALLAAPARAQDDVTPADLSSGALAKEEARAIAEDAFIYGYPMVDSYRINFAFYLFPGNPEYKGPQNQLLSIPRLLTPKDTAVQTPNSDTPYSFFGADLRAEPFVITVPEIEKERYFTSVPSPSPPTRRRSSSSRFSISPSMRLYWPKDEALAGSSSAPKLIPLD